MRELLKCIEEKIEEVNKRKLYTVDEDGNELDIDSYDGEGIYCDGITEGLYDAYTTVRDEILKRIK